MLNVLKQYNANRGVALPPIVTNMGEEFSYARGQVAARSDMPRWWQAIKAMTDEERRGMGVTIPVHGSFLNINRSFFRHGGPALHAYFDQLKRELGDGWWVQYWWDVSICRFYVRPLRPLEEIESRLAVLDKLSGFSNEDAIFCGRLMDEKDEIERLANDGRALNIQH